MKDIVYKVYTKKEMLEIIKKYPFIFVETSLGDDYIIKLTDIPDFIMLESDRTLHTADMEMYIPGKNEPVLTTCGCFLNRIDSKLRETIIDRLNLLQTRCKKARKVKIFDNDVFSAFSAKELGIENGKIKNFKKIYGNYINIDKAGE